MKFKIKVVFKGEDGFCTWYNKMGEGTTQYENEAHVFSVEDISTELWTWFGQAENDENHPDFLRLKLVV